MVQSVSRALDLLEALATVDELGVTELANKVSLQPSTTHRLLATLTERGYVIRHQGTAAYALGFKTLEIASVVRDRTNRLRTLARPRLETIQRLTAETANLAVLQGTQVAYIDQVAAMGMVRVFTQVGRALPAHTTGAGKAMLAYRSDEEIRQIYSDTPFERPTEHTIGNIGELLLALEEVRTCGYAVDHEEREEGVSCVAATVFDEDSTPCAALSVSGLTTKLLRTDVTDLGELLHTQARELSKEWGCQAFPPGPDQAA